MMELFSKVIILIVYMNCPYVHLQSRATKGSNCHTKSEFDFHIVKRLVELEKQHNDLMADYLKQINDYDLIIADLEKTLKDQGSTYVRWGKTTCRNGTEKVYSGFTAGSPFTTKGGAASYICLPEHPTWAQYIDGIQDVGGYVSGTEYEIYSTHKKLFGKVMHNQDAPCAVCRSPRPTTLMIPGHTGCFSGWILEYTGYLMTGQKTHTGGTDYACVDTQPEAVYHGEADQNGKLLYFTEVKCGSLPCQEYPDGRELACVVCSK